MKIPRDPPPGARPSVPARRPAPRRARPAPRGARPAVAALLALAAAIALVAPRVPDRPAEDAAADGIALAARCDARVAADREAWSACIAEQLGALPADPVAATGVHFHAWRVAARAARDGTPGAARLRDAHRERVRAALRDNLTSLHRLCTAAGAPDCAALGDALAASG